MRIFVRVDLQCATVSFRTEVTGSKIEVQHLVVNRYAINVRLPIVVQML